MTYRQALRLLETDSRSIQRLTGLLRLLFKACLLSLMFCSYSFAAFPPEWKKTAFAFEANQTSLRKTLASFCNTFGVSLSISSKLSGTVDGKLKSNSAQDFLNRLAIEHKFLWFVYNGTLYVSPLKEQTSELLDVSEDAVPDLKNALTQIGLLDDRFGWGELPDEGTVIVSGPKRYVKFVRSLSRKKKKGDEKKEVMVFPLKYALADDRSINYRNKSINIPGVASMLSNLLGGGKKAPLAIDTMDFKSPAQSMEAFSAMQENSISRINNRIADRYATPSEINAKLSDNSKVNSTISADTRNNAILIRDDYERKEMYEDLIAQLDQPRHVIEIDAIILDIDREKLSELGFNWQGGSGNTEAKINTSGADPFLKSGSSATVTIQDFDHFFAQIRALETDGDASLVANPSILTIENQPAIIDFNNTAFIKSTGERVANVSEITAGTSLQVLPRLIDSEAERVIQLFLDIEDGDIESNSGADTPSVSKGSISTQAVIKTERSLVIGGFKVEQNTQRESKVPLLGELPGIGKLFSYTSKAHSKRERLFIITPRLVGNESNPLQYVSKGDQEMLAEALESQKDKHARDFLKITRAQVGRAFEELINLYIPNGFSLQTSAPYGIEYYCSPSEHFKINTKKLQWYNSEDYSILVGKIRNESPHPNRFDESSCSHKDTIAVSVRPDTMLKPWESVEVLLAVRLPNKNKKQRNSLISSNHDIHH
ncbi:EscC/YscC/HrcC family type III secretion system outer membrane ring protein [Marinomonas mediterranea]|uniref:type III secretion system outer membrane ring subunit SctC n=1 Tax=Marinomonas mediterranea TaxID=119864 RepID=UPI00234B465F|nr:type III secretion system outer membrane ring subunit SctC [Marinomonas mediterranea]WCN12450.1 EscC/YscC/HrcC family type III secretion system outer membrane ring protein [Marinomonas mediterranea]